MERVIHQVHLNLPGMSGRGVRIQVLTPSEKRQADFDAAERAGAEASVVKVHDFRMYEGMVRMICEVTEKPSLESVTGEGAHWHRVTLQELCTDGPWSLDALFTPKDVEILEALYRKFHEVSLADVDAIMGKALPVASSD